jgi:hypothetical protein
MGALHERKCQALPMDAGRKDAMGHFDGFEGTFAGG